MYLILFLKIFIEVNIINCLSHEYEKEKDIHLVEICCALFPIHLASRSNLSTIC